MSRVELNKLAYQKAIQKGLKKMAFDYLSLAQRAAEKDWKDQGQFAASLPNSEINASGSRVKIQIADNEGMKAIVQEFGRRPGSSPPPFDALVGWAIRKLGVPGRVTGKYDEQPHETRWIIRNIARSIGRKGIKPRKIFEKTFKKNKNKLLNSFKEGFNRIRN